MITEDYVSFETAKLLKEKGFDEATHQFYKTITYLGTEANNICIKTLDGIESEPFHNSVYGYDLNGENTGEYACPTLQMAMRWLRETFEIHCQIVCPIAPSWMYAIRDLSQDKWVTSYIGDYKTYEEACEAAIKYCLENLV